MRHDPATRVTCSPFPRARCSIGPRARRRCGPLPAALTPAERPQGAMLPVRYPNGEHLPTRLVRCPHRVWNRPTMSAPPVRGRLFPLWISNWPCEPTITMAVRRAATRMGFAGQVFRSGGCGIERCRGPGQLGRQRGASDRRLGAAHDQGTFAARRRRDQRVGASKPASGSLTTNAGSAPNPRPLLTAGARPRTAPDASLTLSRSPRPPNVFDIGAFAFHRAVCYTF